MTEIKLEAPEASPPNINPVFKTYENEGDIIFYVKISEVLRLKENGDILVKGELVENAHDVVSALRKILCGEALDAL